MYPPDDFLRLVGVGGEFTTQIDHVILGVCSSSSPQEVVDAVGLLLRNVESGRVLLVPCSWGFYNEETMVRLSHSFPGIDWVNPVNTDFEGHPSPGKVALELIQGGLIPK